MLIAWKCSALLIPQAWKCTPLTKADDRKISPAPTPDYSLKFPRNLPVSHLLPLDISPHLVCEYANNAGEHGNNKSGVGKGDDHLSSIRYIGQAPGEVLCVPQCFPFLTADENHLGSEGNKNMLGSHPLAIKSEISSTILFPELPL